MRKTAMILFSSFFLAQGAVAGNVSAKSSPSAFLPKTEFTFEPVVEGTEVVHEFILKNKGDETLVIQKLSSG